MSDATKNLLIRILIHSAVLFVLYILQMMVFSRLRIFGIAPLILPLAVVGVGIFEGASWGGAVGLAAGVLTDMSFLSSTVLFTILLTGIGMGVGLLSSYLLSRGFPSYLICGAAALVLIAFCQMFTLLVFHRQPPLALFRVGALQTLYSILFAMPIYYVCRSLGRRNMT